MQEMPTVGKLDVTPEVIKDIKARAKAGRKKYKKPLQTFNGRSALQDLYEELLDAAQYIKQLLMEQECK